LPFDAGIEIMLQSITPPQEEPVAEEVAAPTNPKTLAKIAVTEAIRNATIQDSESENFVINGKTYTFKSEGVNVPALRSFCNKNGIRTDDGNSLHNANRGAVERGSHQRQASSHQCEEDPRINKKESKKDKGDGKATPVNQFHLANVMYGEASKEPLQNRGASLTKNDLIISSAGSMAGDKDFYEAAMQEYNKEKHDEYDTLHFASDIVVDDKNLPKVFTTLNDRRDLKRVLYKEVMASLDKV
jgi:hypothetical protein